jgi:hypothetical protein
VRRVSDGRERESDRWQTALLLNEYLHPGHPRALGDDHWQPGRIEPHDDKRHSFSIEPWDDLLKDGTVVTLTPGAGRPQDRAREMSDFLMTTPLGQWPVTRLIHRDTVVGD